MKWNQGTKESLFLKDYESGKFDQFDISGLTEDLKEKVLRSKHELINNRLMNQKVRCGLVFRFSSFGCPWLK